MKIDCIADLHGEFPILEGGDLLIVAGDLTATDKPEEYFKFEEWFEVQNYRRKIVIAGNHDNYLVKYGHNLFQSTEEGYDQYLCDSGTEFQYWEDPHPPMRSCELRKLKIWGSPWTKTFPNMNSHCKAFTVDTDYDLGLKFSLIPKDIDILITHSPAHGILDKIRPRIIPRCDAMCHVGSTYLYNWLEYTHKPKLHVFGHIHEGYGKTQIFKTGEGNMMISVNASIMNEDYHPVNKPIRIIL